MKNTASLAGVVLGTSLVFMGLRGMAAPECRAAEPAESILSKAGLKRGICLVLQDPAASLALDLTRNSELTVYLQLEDAAAADSASRSVDAAGFYGTRLYVARGSYSRLHLGDNTADIVVAPAGSNVPEAEVRRVLNPLGRGWIGDKEITKPFPKGIDDWAYSTHGPDNSKQSRDEVARWPFMTQFLFTPWVSAQPHMEVASGGRLFSAYGNEGGELIKGILNTLVARNAYNGTILWERKLRENFWSYRNALIATPDAVYLADDVSCKVLNAATGEVKKEIAPPRDLVEGIVWKWMALDKGVLYALVGREEQAVSTTVWPAYGRSFATMSYKVGQVKDTEKWDTQTYPWGMGQDLLAIEVATGKVLWHHRENGLIDGRGMCLSNGRIFCFAPEKFLACREAASGRELWRKTPENSPKSALLFKPMGRWWRDRLFVMVPYIFSNDSFVYLAAEWTGRLTAYSAADGKEAWSEKCPWHQFVLLRPDGLFTSVQQLDLATGKVLKDLKGDWNACGGFTGSIEGLFGRSHGHGVGGGGTGFLNLTTGRRETIHVRRTDCMSGVTISNGHLYWWPWPCGCVDTVWGGACLGPAGAFPVSQTAVESERLERYAKESDPVALFEITEKDCTSVKLQCIPSYTERQQKLKPPAVAPRWEQKLDIRPEVVLTAPVTAGDLVFLAGSDGIIRALDRTTGAPRWKAYTGGSVRFPPALWQGRALAGSCDGWVYCFEAATGRLLWRFRAAPEERRIMVYGQLYSTWPVSPPVRVQKDCVYAAAGITDYDGTHVYALNAATGRIKWQNNTSGHLDKEGRVGVCVQGNMEIGTDGKLYLAGGAVVSPAIYDLETGSCLNEIPKAAAPSPKQPRESTPATQLPLRGWRLTLIDGKPVVTEERKGKQAELFYDWCSVFYQPFAQNVSVGYCQDREGRKIQVLRDGRVQCLPGKP